MKRRIKINIIGEAFLLGSVLVGTAACSDDHFDIVATGTASVSIMDNINAQEDLSGFASILERTLFMRSEYSQNGTISYADLLSTSQNFTVWAPVDGDWDPQVYLAILDSAEAVRTTNPDRFWELNRQVEMQFVRNHISRVNYEATPELQTVRLMNDKRCAYNIGGNTFNDIAMVGTGIASSNGMLRKLSEISPYAYNIYDYIAQNSDWSDLYTYIHSQDSLMFDASSSVEGTIINGEQVYADSAFTLSSPISAYLGSISSEDSTYVGVLPTNSGWTAAYEKYKSYYEYGTSYNYTFNSESGSFIYSDGDVTDLYSGLLDLDDDDDADSLQEIMTKTTLLSCMFFSATQVPTLDVTTASDDAILNAVLTADSLRSDYYYYIYNPNLGGLNPYFVGSATGAPYYASNGYIYTVDSLLLDASQTIQGQNEIDVEGESLTHVYLSAGSVITVELDNNTRDTAAVKGNVHNDSYARYVRDGDGQMIVDFPLTGVYSAKYDIHVVMLPSSVSSDYTTEGENIVFNASILLDDDTSTRPSASISSVQVDSTQVDDILLFEDFRFEKCYAGLSTTTFPRLRLTLPRGTSSQSMALNIDRIYLVPKGND